MRLSGWLHKDGSGRVAVRHSKHPHDAVIVYTRAEWEAFTVVSASASSTSDP